jgi:nicotinamide-nucleotide amidase
MKIGKCRFYFVPGVPFEMKRMLEDYVLPDIVKLQDNKQIITVKTISTFGLGESTVGEKTAAVTDKFNVKLGLRAAFPEVQVKLYAQGSNSNELDSVLSEASAWIKEQLGKYVFSMDGLPMEKVIGDILLSRNATLALAESCTGGLISDLITNVPGSSEYFLFSGVTYSNNSKMNVLGVRQETLEKFGAVSEETVREMAEGARRISGADYALATSGIAGPDGGTDEKPVGTVCIGLATPEKTITKRRETANRQLGSSQETRMRIKRWFAMMSLEILRRELTGILDND